MRAQRKRRLRQIERLLRRHPEGMRPAEIARALRTHRSTILRDLAAMEEVGILLQEDDRGVIGLFRCKGRRN